MRGYIKSFGILLALSIADSTSADTIDHYMNIVTNLPQMEMKADSESQAWARSARNILMLTSETIAESLLLANAEATKEGTPLFCPPPGEKLSNSSVNEIIKNAYTTMPSNEINNRNNLTVSQVALIGLQKEFPCKKKKDS